MNTAVGSPESAYSLLLFIHTHISFLFVVFCVVIRGGAASLEASPKGSIQSQVVRQHAASNLFVSFFLHTSVEVCSGCPA